MPTLETPPNPAPPTPPQPPKVRTGRFGELEEHELIHLIDALDDERAKARFRESVYISVFVYIFVAWFVFYGPRWLPMPKIVNPPIQKEQQSQQMANLAIPKDLQRELARQAPKPAPKPTPQPQQQAVETPQPSPLPEPKPAPAQPQAQQQARPMPPTPQTNTVPTPQPPRTPPPPAPQASSNIPDAPRPSFNRSPQSAGEAIREATRESARSGGSGATTSPNLGGGRSPLGSGAEILTDTQGVDFRSWLNRFKSDVYRNWEPLIPESVRPPISKRGLLNIRITILQGGKISNVVLETRSGDVALDKAAWNALIAEGTYPPLPREFPGPNIEIRCTFTYNEPPL